MLSDKLREGAQGKIFKFLFWIIILSFIFAGVGGYLIPRLNTDPVTVGDYPITANEWNEQYNRQTQQMHRQFGAEASRLLENPQYVAALRTEILENMISNVALNSAVFATDVRIGDEQVREVIRTIPAFQRDGKFDNDLYLASVRNMGMNPEYFGEQLRLSLMTDFVRNPVINTAALPLPYELSAITDLFMQQRLVDIYTLNPEHLKQDIKVADSEVQAYYDAHHADFMAPAQVKFTYLLLDSNELKKQVKYTDEDLENFLSLNQDDFMQPETREVRHILVKADAADAAERIAKIDAALAQGEDFATLATTYSDDESAKTNGGSLGQVSRGNLAPNLDSVAFSLSAGQVSEKIVDNYGTHYLKVEKINPPAVPEFSQIKNQVAQAYVNDKARELYQNDLNTMSDLSFENPDSLDVTAENLKLTVQDCTGLNQGDTKAPWPLNTPALQDAAFNEENYTSGINSPVINISESVAMVINVYDYHEAQLRSFDEVKAEATAQVVDSKAQEQSYDILADFARKLQADPHTALPEDVTVRTNVQVDRGASEFERDFGLAIFAIPQDGDARYCIARNHDAQALAVLKQVTRYEDPLATDYDALMRAQMVQYYQDKLQRALYAGARELTTIEYNQEAIDMINQQNRSEE